jgi:hypothetical protein
MFNILNHKGNTHQNTVENPSHPSQHDYHQENRQQQMLGDVGKKESSYTVCGNAN